MRYQKRDLLVGGFVVLSVLILSAAAILKAGFDFGYYYIYAEFDHIQSISEGSKVRVQGVEIGQVRHIDFDPYSEESHIRLKLAIDLRYAIYEGTYAQISSSTPLSGYFVELILGDQGGERIPPGGKIKGKSAYDVAELLSGFDEILKKVDVIAQKIIDIEDQVLALNVSDRGAVFFDQSARIFTGVDSLVTTSNTAMKTLDKILVEHHTAIGGVYTRADSTMMGLQHLLVQADTSLVRTLGLVDANLQQSEASLRALKDLLGTNKTQIDTMIKNLSEASASLKDLSQHPYKLLTGGIGAEKEKEKQAP